MSQIAQRDRAVFSLSSTSSVATEYSPSFPLSPELVEMLQVDDELGEYMSSEWCSMPNKGVEMIKGCCTVITGDLLLHVMLGQLSKGEKQFIQWPLCVCYFVCQCYFIVCVCVFCLCMCECVLYCMCMCFLL